MPPPTYSISASISLNGTTTHKHYNPPNNNNEKKEKNNINFNLRKA